MANCRFPWASGNKKLPSTCNIHTIIRGSLNSPDNTTNVTFPAIHPVFFFSPFPFSRFFSFFFILFSPSWQLNPTFYTHA
ncbi:hypothetical protein BDV35DRAFT_170115 [Aspergillus flavus]|uniref:Uncharacterized protein n=1 Tax=Aspergillus flavus TaxID=5059 RepID=A0A5N6H1L7_ASPFL|nr:hypothetical protein BDV35DRAFT_170115 [Aspergillus flavus]